MARSEATHRQQAAPSGDVPSAGVGVGAGPGPGRPGAGGRACIAQPGGERLVRVPATLLAQAAPAGAHIPDCYHHRSHAMRWIFWRRLAAVQRALARRAGRRRRVLDLGCGNGVFLPTLVGMFEQVVALDRDLAAARTVVRALGLSRVEMVEADVGGADFGRGHFDAIVCADVLEHLHDLRPALLAIGRWLAPGGVLVTSLPTENRLYALARRPFGQMRPPDHYHTAAEVEGVLRARGLLAVRRRQVPFGLPLFSVVAWRQR